MIKMGSRGIRQTVYLCSSIRNGSLFNKIIPAASENEAALLFSEQYNFKPQEILGPFFHKKAKVVEDIKELKFTNKTKKAIYNEWIVNAFLLSEPKDYAYLVFIRRLDCEKLTIPKGNIIVPISDLKCYEE